MVFKARYGGQKVVVYFDYWGMPEGHPDKCGKGILTHVRIVECKRGSLLSFKLKGANTEWVPISCVTKIRRIKEKTK